MTYLLLCRTQPGCDGRLTAIDAELSSEDAHAAVLWGGAPSATAVATASFCAARFSLHTTSTGTRPTRSLHESLLEPNRLLWNLTGVNHTGRDEPHKRFTPDHHGRLTPLGCLDTQGNRKCVLRVPIGPSDDESFRLLDEMAGGKLARPSCARCLPRRSSRSAQESFRKACLLEGLAPAKVATE